MKLSVQSISCQRGGRQVLSDLSVTLEPGHAYVLRGPNGAGKSTLLRVVAGLVEHQEGELSWLDEAGSRLDPDEHAYGDFLHYVGHLDAVKPSLTVRENLNFWAQLYGAGDKVEAALAHMGLGGLGDVSGGFLSAGQKKRLSLARLLLAERPLWLLDEPTVSLDEAGTRLVAELMRDFCERKAGMVLVATHIDLGLTPDHLVALTLERDGRLEASP